MSFYQILVTSQHYHSPGVPHGIKADSSLSLWSQFPQYVHVSGGEGLWNQDLEEGQGKERQVLSSDDVAGQKVQEEGRSGDEGNTVRL